MSIRIYLRDWYFNAGIAGMLYIASGGKSSLAGIPIEIGDNYIDVKEELLNGFTDNFFKSMFIGSFDVEGYLTDWKVNNAIAKCNESKKKGFTPSKFIENIDKGDYKGFADVMGFNFNCPTEKTLTDKITETREKLMIEPEALYKDLTDGGQNNFIEEVVKRKIGGITGRYGRGPSKDSIEKDYITATRKIFTDKKIKKTKYICVSCQERNATIDFSKTFVAPLGYNSDNWNWFWGPHKGEVKICPICALVYLCAPVMFIPLLVKRGSNWIRYYYTVNHNTSVDRLYKSLVAIKEKINEVRENPLTGVSRAVLLAMKKEQAAKVQNHIIFIQMESNGGLGENGYNIQTFHLAPDTAQFLVGKFEGNKFPEGVYRIGKNDETIRIGDEILRYIYSRTLSYNHLNQYCRISISKNIESKYFNLEKVCNVIIEYISLLKGGSMDISKITDKGFAAGKGLYVALRESKRVNQVDGLAYQFLNDLKVQDWQRFFDRYSRLAMANKLHIAFGLDEMNDMDVFQQFGYSFVLGLVDGLNPMEKTTKEVSSNG